MTLNTFIKTLIALTLINLVWVPSVLSNTPTTPDPSKWSASDNRCPKSSDGFFREAGELQDAKGIIHYWCYWFDQYTQEHNISVRPANVFGGVSLSIQQKDKTGTYYKNYLINCARQEVNGLGMCGWT